MPEVRALNKRMKIQRPQGGSSFIKSFYDYINWYRIACKMTGSYTAYVDLQKCICSGQRTNKVVALIRLAAIQIGEPID